MAAEKLDFELQCSYLWADQNQLATGEFRCFPDDFVVHEVLDIELSGEGEHLYLQIEKIGQNTHWVIEEAARQLGIARELFGYAGIKDRHALTTQWVSVQDPQAKADLSKLNIPGVRVIGSGRHHKKLRRGGHSQNRFQLNLRGLSAGSDQIEPLLKNIASRGFPNYFGAQRFGFDNGNLERGWALLSARRLSNHKKKSIYLSALRSFVFNKILDQRLRDDIFAPGEFDSTGPLWGRGRPSISDLQQAYEQKVLVEYQPLCHALEYSGLSAERRQLLVVPEALNWNWLHSNHLQINFALPPGSYATSLLRELGHFEDMSTVPNKSPQR